MTGLEFREWAEKENLRDVDIASATGVTSQAVQNWFAKSDQLPKRTVLLLLGAGLRVPVKKPFTGIIANSAR